MRPPLLVFVLVFLLAPLRAVRAAEQFFEKGDVIALVGGEDMVVASEYGYLELLLTRALPDYHLRFRNLAWEGDTVFEQRRDLNFPTWEEQLDKIGATVVICQFGLMESLGNEGKMKPGGTTAEGAMAELPKFIAAYEKLLERLSSTGKRRVIILLPYTWPEDPRSVARPQIQPNDAMRDAVFEFAVNRYFLAAPWLSGVEGSPYRDGFHLSALAHFYVAYSLAVEGLHLDLDYLDHGRTSAPKMPGPRGVLNNPDEPLRQLIIAKNKLWFDYWRPQNWAFLAGDRTNQPSSRDWRDPSIRWFPPEREEFLPLIEAKEKEIDALALKLQQEAAR